MISTSWVAEITDVSQDAWCLYSFYPTSLKKATLLVANVVKH
jgi:hypothetical protein